jgi:hypothetical protein
VAEEWRAVVGYEGLYEVSDQGRVRSLERKVPRGSSMMQVRGKILSPAPDTSGHLHVGLSRLGHRTSVPVHKMVMMAFVGPRPEGKVTRHLDGDHRNNCLTNLVYGTHRENMIDIVRHGLHASAKKTHCKWGHPLSGDNLYVPPGDPNRRACWTCVRYWRKRAK